MKDDRIRKEGKRKRQTKKVGRGQKMNREKMRLRFQPRQ